MRDEKQREEGGKAKRKRGRKGNLGEGMDNEGREKRGVRRVIYLEK